MPRTRLTALFLTLVVTGTACSGSAGQPEATIGRLVDRHVELDKFNGSLLVAKGREVVDETTHRNRRPYPRPGRAASS
jgi:hypothetical protein